MFCLNSYQNLKFAVPNFFCLGPLVWIQFILLMLRFFNIIGLGAVDYDMADSAVCKKPSKARGTYSEFSLIKAVSQLEKMQAFMVPCLQ